MKLKVKVKLLLFIVFLLLFVTAAKTTYARYVATATSNVDLSISKWQISVNNNDITSNYNTQLTFTPTLEENTNIKKDTVAPGTKGYFDIQINPENVDVSFVYSVMIQIPEDTEVSDLKVTHYSIINADDVPDAIVKIPYTENIQNTMLYNNEIDDFKFSQFTIRIYFEWFDGTDNLMGDIEDTVIGNKAASNEKINFNILASINFKQYI